MFADTWRIAETLVNNYSSTFKPDATLQDSLNLNLQPTNQLPEPNYPTSLSQSNLINQLLTQLYGQTSPPTPRQPHHPAQDPGPHADPDNHDSLQQHEQQQQQQQQQFFELFMKFLKHLPPKTDSPTKSPTEQSLTDPVATIHDLSLTKCSDPKDMSLDLNNLSNSTWGTIPSPSDKSSPTLNRSEILLDFKSPSMVKDAHCPSLIDSESQQRRQQQQQQQRRQPFAHLNYPNLNSSLSPRKLRDLQLPDQWKFCLNQLNQIPAHAAEGQDWNSQFKAMCDRLHKDQDGARMTTSSSHSPGQIDHTPSMLSAHYYTQFLRCQQYYESYMQWFRLLGVNRLGHSDLENGQPTHSMPSSVAPSPTHQSPVRPYTYMPPLVANPFCSLPSLDSRSPMPADLSTGRRCPNVLKNKRRSPIKVITKPRFHQPHFDLETTNNNNNHNHSHSSMSSTSTTSLANSADDNQHFACKLCPKIYSQASALKMHVRTHTLPCRCSYCGKSFSRKWLLKGHERTHTGERPYACPICNRSFADRSNLRAHMQTHQRDKRYSCPRCPRSFSRMGLLNKHISQCGLQLNHLPRSLGDTISSLPPPPPPAAPPLPSVLACMPSLSSALSVPTSISRCLVSQQMRNQ